MDILLGFSFFRPVAFSAHTSPLSLRLLSLSTIVVASTYMSLRVARPWTRCITMSCPGGDTVSNQPVRYAKPPRRQQPQTYVRRR